MNDSKSDAAYFPNNGPQNPGEELARLRRELDKRIQTWGTIAEMLEDFGRMSNAQVVRTHIREISYILDGGKQ